MSEASAEHTKVSLPAFHGKKKDYTVWINGFRAYCELKGYADVLVKNSNLPVKEDTFDQDADIEKKQKLAVSKNRKAVANMRLAFKTAELQFDIDATKSTNYPEGLAWQVIESLEKLYNPRDMMTSSEAETALSKIKFAKEDDPNKFITKLKALKSKYPEHLSNVQLNNAVVKAAPKKYITCLNNVNKKIGDYEKITLNDYLIEMLAVKRIDDIRKGHEEPSDDESEDEGTEKALSGVDNSGECYNCGGRGHKAAVCPSKKMGGDDSGKNKFSPGKKRFSGNCNLCGKPGHKKADCWDLESNKSKRPNGWKPKNRNDEANGAVDDEITEVCLSCFDAREVESSIQVEPAKPEVPDDFWDMFSVTDDDGEREMVDDVLSEDGSEFEHDEFENTGLCADGSDESELINKQVVCEKCGECNQVGSVCSCYLLDDKVTIPPLVQRVHDDSSCDDDSDGSSIESEDSELNYNEWDQYDPALVSTGSFTEGTLQELLTDHELWVGDTGCTADTTSSDIGMVNCRKGKAKDGISSFNGWTSNATKVGEIPGEHEGQKVRMNEVAHNPGTRFNLFSITRLMELGWKLSGDEKGMVLTKGTSKIMFNHRVKTGKGVLWCARIKRNEGDVGLAALCENNKQKMSIASLHAALGHAGEQYCRKAAPYLNIELTPGGMDPCAACLAAKAKKESVNYGQHKHSEVVNGRVYLDMTRMMKPGGKQSITKPNWVVIVDECTGMKHSEFFQSKSDMVEPTCELFHEWKQRNKPVQIVRCDNAGENKSLEKRLRSADWKMGDIEFEYTARDSPQMNGIAEKGIDTLYNRARAMMQYANVPDSARPLIGKDCITTATMLDSLLLTEVNGEVKTRYEHFHGTKPRYANHLKIWGTAGIVKLKTTKTTKLQDRGKVCMFVGYGSKHHWDTYRMFDAESKQIYITRDVKWLKCMYYTASGAICPHNYDGDGLKPVVDGKGGNDCGDDDDEQPLPMTTQHNINDDDSDDSDDEINDNKTQAIDDTTANGRTIRVRNTPARLTYERLGEVANGAFSKEELQYYSIMAEMNEFATGEIARPAGTDLLLNELGLVGTVGNNFGNTQELRPMKYKEAMANEADVEKWKEAVEEEYRKFEKYKVFKPVNREDVPPGAKFVSTTWAMKKKPSGVHRARMNMRGFEQVDGQHYNSDDTNSPVTNDLSIRIMLVLMLMTNWVGYLVDIKGAFLHGEFDNGEQIHTEIPEGFESKWDPKIWVWLLLKTVYGLKQAAKSFWVELLKAMKYMKFKRSMADPCLYWKYNEETGYTLWLSWIDDCLCLGPKENVIKAKGELCKLYDCDDIGEFNEYVGCEVSVDRVKRELKFRQAIMLQSFEDEFELPSYDYQTPGEPGQVLTKCEDGDEVEPQVHSSYRSGVGKLLHMMRWSRPEIYNAVRETSRHMQKPNNIHYKAMLRIMKYCVLTKDRGWTLKPSRVWNGTNRNFRFRIRGKSDSNYATCPDTRRSVTGYIIYMEDAVIMVKSGMQKIVALSVTEAEIISVVQAVQEMVYSKKVLESIDLQVELPMLIEVDNKGAVDLINGWSVNGGTKHMDVRIMYLRQLKEQGIIKVQWISTKNNEADIFTKNVNSQDFERHVKSLHSGV